MTEIGNSIDYHILYSRPEIVLFSVTPDGKNSERQIMEMIKEASHEVSNLPFLINGFVKRTPDKNHGLSLAIEASSGIEKFCSELERLLSSEEIKYQNFLENENLLYLPLMDYPGFFDAEIILRHAQQNERSLITGLLSFAQKRPGYKIREFVLPAEGFRIGLHDDKGLQKTYDLVLKRWTDKNDIHRSKESFGKYRRMREYESINVKYTENKDCFIISDLHLGHRPIIEGAARPYYPGDSKKMDAVLIRNWNNTVKPSDTVWYLGDLTYNLNFDTCSDYLSQLNGEIIFVRGNHDVCMQDCPENIVASYLGREYFLVHDPKYRQDNYSGWMIHGHVHNSRMADYPFIDFKNKSINACCELTGYHPVNLRDIDRVLNMYENAEINIEKILLYEDLLNITGKNIE